MRPWLKPALRRIWRDRRTVQFGVGPAHAVLIHPRSPGESALLDLLDGTRELPELVERAAGLGLEEADVRRVLSDLERARVLDDADRQQAVLEGVPELSPAALRRLGPELSALSLARPEPGGGAVALAARREAWVRVHGAGRVGAAVAAQLAAAGVGRVEVVDGGRVSPTDPLPGGLRPADIGRLRAGAAAEAVRRASPTEEAERRERRGAGGAAAPAAAAGRRTDGCCSSEARSEATCEARSERTARHADGRFAGGPGAGCPAARRQGTDGAGHRLDGSAAGGAAASAAAGPAAREGAAERRDGGGPTLVVVAPRGPAGAWAPDPELSARLVADGTPHLFAGVVETVGTIGPMVLPGASPCGRCLALHRAAVDPDWPRVLAQLCSAKTGGADAPCAAALAAGVAALAALHALILLDGGYPPSVGGILELSMLDGEMRRRPLSAHPDCGCGWTVDAPPAPEFHRPHGGVRTGERV